MATKNTATATYLVTPNSLLSSFALKSDRTYFSSPVLVEVLYSELSTKFLFVRDPKRGHVYPTRARYIVTKEVA